jgi:predicted 3-demethylubiquinone-9 3-methyltransferase (glyoxalase superfamily)
MQKMTPFFWYDGNVAEAMEFYRSVFPGSKVLSTTPGPNGSLMSATFELDGQRFIAFNGGHTEAHARGIDVRELRDAGRSGRALGQAD